MDKAAQIVGQLQQRLGTLRIAREIGKLATAEERQPLIDDVMAGRLNTADVRSIVRTVTTSATATPSTRTGTGPAILDATSIQGETAPSEVSGIQATDAPKQAAEKERATTARLQQEIGTVRVILARWQNALTEMPARERATLAIFIEEIFEASTQLRAGLHGQGKRDR